MEGIGVRVDEKCGSESAGQKVRLDGSVDRETGQLDTSTLGWLRVRVRIEIKVRVRVTVVLPEPYAGFLFHCLRSKITVIQG